MLELLTPMNKLERVSRSIDAATFVAAPGIWAQVQADGSLLNALNNVRAKVNKLVIGSASTDKYESHDVEVGRITTLETLGCRVKTDTAGFGTTIDGSLASGDLLLVSSKTETLGKLLVTSTSTANCGGAGDYEVVARLEEVSVTGGYVVYRTISPYLLAKS